MVNVKRYIINYTKLVHERIPDELSHPLFTALALVLVTPFVLVYNSLLTFRIQLLYKLSITPQVVFLEKMLNDRYDTTARRIYIRDGKEYNPIYLFQKSEFKPTFLFQKTETTPLKIHMFLKNETGQYTYDFIVYVPAVVAFDMNELMALVNIYKLAAKSCKVQII